MGSEPVEFDRRLWNALFSQEVGDLETLIALELDDLAKFFVVNKSTVACKILSRSVSHLVIAACPVLEARTFLKAFSNFLRSYSTIPNVFVSV
jgi:hypothetical protein